MRHVWATLHEVLTACHNSSEPETTSPSASHTQAWPTVMHVCTSTPTIYSKKPRGSIKYLLLKCFPTAGINQALNAGYKVKGYKIMLLWGGKTSEDSDSVRVYSACSHVHLQAVFQRPDWMSWGGLWGASKHLLLSAQANAWANINTAPPPRVQSSCCPHPWHNTWAPTWKIKNYCVICPTRFAYYWIVYSGLAHKNPHQFST